MILFDENILLDALQGLPFQVNGIGMFKDLEGKKLVVLKNGSEYTPIGINDTNNGGYLRYSGNVPLTPNGKIDCSTYLYEGNAEIILVIGVKGYDMAKLLESITYRLSIQGLTIKSVNENKDQILSEEGIGANTLNFLKIVFNYQFDYSSNCEDVTDICVC